MPTSVTIRDVPDRTRDELAAQAAAWGDLSADAAALAHADLLALGVDLFPYEPFATRVWELRENLTSHDGWYVALAEALGARLATLDEPLARASGPRCGFRTPGEGRRERAGLGHPACRCAAGMALRRLPPVYS